MDFSRFTTISFDCYGTLIDWESGILPVLRAVLANHGQSLPDAAILELYAEFEAEAESGPYQSYRTVLHSVVRAFADRLHFIYADAEATERGIRWRDHGGTGEKLQTFPQQFPDGPAHARAFSGSTSSRRTEHLSRCGASTVAGDLDGVGEPKVGSSRDWRSSNFPGEARPGDPRSGQSRRTYDTSARLMSTSGPASQESSSVWRL